MSKISPPIPIQVSVKKIPPYRRIYTVSILKLWENYSFHIYIVVNWQLKSSFHAMVELSQFTHCMHVHCSDSSKWIYERKVLYVQASLARSKWTLTDKEKKQIWKGEICAVASVISLVNFSPPIQLIIPFMGQYYILHCAHFQSLRY